MRRVRKETITKGAFKGREVSIYEPFVPILDGRYVKTMIDPQTGKRIYSRYYIVPDPVAKFIHAGEYDYAEIRKTHYSVFGGSDNVKGTLIDTSEDNGNFYAHRSVEDYIRYIDDPKTPETKKECWTGIPLPIVFNAEGGDIVRVESGGGYIDYPASGRATRIYNFTPGQEYTVRVMKGDQELSHETFTAEGEVRLVKIGDQHNCRDIGNKICRDDEGNEIGRIPFGRIIRGSSLATATKEDIATLTGVLGVNVVIDLSKENDLSLGSGIEYFKGSKYGWYDNDTYKKLCTDTATHAKVKAILEIFAEKLSQGKTIYVQCEYGMVRTGVTCAVIESLCGCSFSDVAKGFELSSYSYNYGFDENTYTALRIDVKEQIRFWFDYLYENYGQNGETLRQQTTEWLTKKVGVKIETIEKIRESLIEKNRQ